MNFTLENELILKKLSRRTIFSLAFATLILLVPLLKVLYPIAALKMRTYDQQAIDLAAKYVDGLDSSSSPALFATSGRTYQAFGNSKLGREGIERYADLMPSFWAVFGYHVDIVVLPGFINGNDSHRTQLISTSRLRKTSEQVLRGWSDTQACAARKYAPHGYVDRGFVLVDPTAGPLTEVETINCIIFGIAFINGFPANRGEFSLTEMPSATAIPIVMDAVMSCAYEGKTSKTPPQRSREWITTYPSINCIREFIRSAKQTS